MLQKNSDMNQRGVAEKLGASTSWLSYYLKVIIDRGWVKVKNFIQNKNKIGYIYVINPAGIVERAMLAGRFFEAKDGRGRCAKG